MEDVKIILTTLWIATMLTFLLGDVLRIFSGDATKMFSEEGEFTQGMWLGIAVMMVIPIIMVVISIMAGNPINRWANIIAAIFFIGLNLIGLPTYAGNYDKFLLIVSMGFNVLTIWYAWNWV